MVYYTVLLILYFLLSFFKLDKGLNNKQSKKILIFLLLPLFLLTAFRDVSVGNDTLNYYNAFKYISLQPSIIEAIKHSRFEIGYVFLNYFISCVTDNYYVLQFLMTVIIYKSLYDFLKKKSENLAMSCFIFLTLRMFIGPMNTVRQWLAISFLFYGISQLEKKNKFKFLLFVLLASTFHKTAIIFSVLLILPYFSNKKFFKLFLFSFGFLLVFFGNKVFMILTSILGLYKGYLNSKYFINFNYLGVCLILIVNIIIFCLFEFYKKDYLINNKNKKIDIRYYICYCALIFELFINIIGLNSTIMGRLSVYFEVFYLISIPHLCKVSIIKNKSYVLQFIIMILFVGIFYTVMIYRPYWNGVSIYKFYFM